MKNSPFKDRLRKAQRAEDPASSNPVPTPPRVHRTFGLPPMLSTPTLDSGLATGESSSSRPETPSDPFNFPRALPMTPSKTYGDRFVPSKDSGDLRTSYHLKDEGSSSTPSKNRIIPSESDAQKGTNLPCLCHSNSCATRASKWRFWCNTPRRGHSSIPTKTRIAHEAGCVRLNSCTTGNSYAEAAHIHLQYTQSRQAQYTVSPS